MNQIIKKTGYVVRLMTTFILAFVLALALAFSAYAWLTNYVSSGGMGFKTGEIDPLALKIAKIPHKTDVIADETSRAYTDCKNYKIESNGDGTHLTVDINNMSFGVIDNVSQLKPENIVYMRLTVPKSAGNQMKVQLNYAEEDFIVLYRNTYDDSGNENGTEQITDSTVLTNLTNLQSEGDAFLLYSCAVSNQAYDANVIADKVEFDETNYCRFTIDTSSEDNVVIVTNQDFALVEDNGYYYIYIKIIPNLDVFANSIQYISDIMPCYMFFKIQATFDFDFDT